MVDDFVDPIDAVRPSNPIEDAGGSRAVTPQRHQTVSGRVVAVHKRSGHKEGHHVLDTSVGASTFSEVVVRIDSGDIGDLVGKQVVISFRP